MTKNIFHWPMSAVPFKPLIDCLRMTIFKAIEQQEQLRIGLFFDLIPINSPQAQLAINRGSFLFSNNRFSNLVNENLRMEFSDPVLKVFYATIPANWIGTTAIRGETLIINFDNRLDLEIPYLGELGIGRSTFQKFYSLEISPVCVTSKLQEDLSTKETWIEVALAQSGQRAKNILSSLKNILDASSTCTVYSDEPRDPWYVYKNTDVQDRRGYQICSISRKKLDPGSYDPMKLEFKAGALTKEQARAYVLEEIKLGRCREDSLDLSREPDKGTMDT